MNKYLQRIENMDRSTAAIVLAKYEKEFAVVESALDRILGGLFDFAEQKERTNSKLESARLILVVRSFNSLRCATQLLRRGYYQQALTLVRMAQEDQLVAEDIELYPATLDALLEGDGMLGKGNLTYAKMAERLSPNAKKSWEERYGATSEFGAHPRPPSMRDILVTGADGKGTLGAGGHYDEWMVRNVLGFASREIISAFGTLAKAVQAAGVNWENPVPAFTEVLQLSNDIEEWAKALLLELEGD